MRRPSSILWALSPEGLASAKASVAAFSKKAGSGRMPFKSASADLARQGFAATLPIAILQYLEWKIDPTIAAVSVLQILFIGGAMLLTDRFVKIGRVV